MAESSAVEGPDLREGKALCPKWKGTLLSPSQIVRPHTLTSRQEVYLPKLPFPSICSDPENPPEMRATKASNLGKIHQFVGSANELKRAKYVLVFLETGSKSLAMKISGLTRPSHSRIIAMYKQRGHAFDAQRSGRPMLYTKSVLETAMATLTSHKGTMSGPELHRKVIEQGVLHPSSHRQRFLLRFSEHVKEEGHQLIANCTKTQFYISKNDEQLRLRYAEELRTLLSQSLTLNQLWFIDEVTLEEEPHPKGERKVL
jgi:hypothetical protein